jgi:putative ABC transport system permease protein
MNFWEAARIALRALRTHRLRSALTMLGIVIGVTAVIVLVAVGTGVQSAINARLQPLASLITVKKSEGHVPGGGEPKELREADLAALKKRAPDIATVIPETVGQVVVTTKTARSRANAIGSTNGWLETNNIQMAVGSFFDATQARHSARVVVVGTTVATNLFGADLQAALHQNIQINYQTFKIIGVMRSGGEPFDSYAVMPIDSARHYVYGGVDEIDVMLVVATQAAAVPAAVDEVINILSDRHRIHDPTKRDFDVQSLGVQIETFQKILRLLTLFTASVAAISLVVGGIGVLNIMLISVTERTREIGIRKAIGATRRAVLEQFLIESVVLAGLGGLVGVLTGLGLSALSAIVAPSFGPTFEEFAPTVSITSVVVAFSFSLTIGVTAGCYPALRAARLRPAEALRYQ